MINYDESDDEFSASFEIDVISAVLIVTIIFYSSVAAPLGVDFVFIKTILN
jgi:hypothetical protein